MFVIYMKLSSIGFERGTIKDKAEAIIITTLNLCVGAGGM